MKNSSFFVTQIDLSLKEKLAEDLQGKGFTLSSAPYAFFTAKKPGVCCTLYQSGKLTVQGKEKDDFITFYLEPEILQNVSYSHPLLSIDPKARIGMDEAGKGDFFGPLCMAGVFAKEGSIEKLLQIGVKDSKQLSDSTIKAISEEIKKHFPYKILRLMPETYNSLYDKFHNLNRLLAWGHATVLQELSEKTGCTHALLDQFALPELMENMLQTKKIAVTLTQRTKAESDPVVAAASILARNAFVEGIEALEKHYALHLPKGASSIVVQKGKEILDKHDMSLLGKVAKLHFKTTEMIRNARTTPHS